MTSSVLDPSEEYRMNPEMMEVVNSYLVTTDATITSQSLGIPREKVMYYLNKPEAKRFVDTVYLEQGYLNRHRLQDILGEVMELKLEEMRESEMGTKKDILDIIALAHKIRADEAKIAGISNEGNTPRNQTNVQINNASEFGENYNQLLEKLINV